MKKGKRIIKLKDVAKDFKGSSLDEIFDFLKKGGMVKFDESVELTLKLGINPKKVAEAVKGTVIFDHGISKKKKILVFAIGRKVEEALEAGATEAGGEELIAKIKDRKKINFDKCLCTREIFPKVVGIAKHLGKKGIMPSEKDGTLTENLKGTIEEIISGKRRTFKNDSAGYISVAFGRLSFDKKELTENLSSFIEALNSVRPTKIKEYVQKCWIGTTMGTSLSLSVKDLFKGIS